jgi:hypothetical protein
MQPLSNFIPYECLDALQPVNCMLCSVSFITIYQHCKIA